MEKRHFRGFSLALRLFARMFFPALSPDSVDNRITALSAQTPLAAAERPSAASQ
ncbi:hypothetical protein NXZ34_25800 [Escherichia coli]|nr:hypothetical protein [Escherichia coli]